MSLKIGDRVKVHSIEWFEKNSINRDSDTSSWYYILPGTNKISFISEMKKFCGEYVTISKYNKSNDSYFVKEDENCCYWLEEFFCEFNIDSLTRNINEYCNNFCIYKDTRHCNNKCYLYTNYIKNKLLPDYYSYTINIGDKVRVKTLKWFEENFKKDKSGSFQVNGFTFTPEMQKYCGSIVIIDDVIESFADNDRFYIIASSPKYVWIELFFDMSYLEGITVNNIKSYCNNSCIFDNCNNPECPLFSSKTIKLASYK